ncbi:MAG TPA: hypothetical protein VF552_04540 [Allosphingosinicella sp.]|jgi:ElaB/YqjD/DUF883 family membrane-anchored ribosome-binding protein
MQQPPNQSGSNASTGSELRSDAEQLGSTAANRIHSEVDARKGDAVSQAQSVSSAISQAADGLDDGAPEWLKSAFRQGAQQIQRFADTIEQKDSREILSDAQSFARNNPGTFLAACAAVGFAAARVLKAGGAQQDGAQSVASNPSGSSRPAVASPQPQGQGAMSPAPGQPAFGFGGPDAGAGTRTRAPGEVA